MVNGLVEDPGGNVALDPGLQPLGGAFHHQLGHQGPQGGFRLARLGVDLGAGLEQDLGRLGLGRFEDPRLLGFGVGVGLGHDPFQLLGEPGHAGLQLLDLAFGVGLVPLGLGQLVLQLLGAGDSGG